MRVITSNTFCKAEPMIDRTTSQTVLKTVETQKAISFNDINAQRQRIGKEVDAAIARVLEHGHYIMGPEVTELEQQLGRFCGAEHVISCSNGTDALGMVLRAKGIRPGDAVFVPAFTFIATAEAVAWLGATPVFVDVEDHSFNLCPASLEQAIHMIRKSNLTAKAIIPVDLFGQPADYRALEEIAQKYNLWILADGAQSFGATYEGRMVGTLADATTTSFFPAKPLGCYGDGGAIFTNDAELAKTLRSIRVHGQGSHKYENIRIGLNGRLDTIQAAILLEKLKIFHEEIASRQKIAERYEEALGALVKTPLCASNKTSVWAQYTIRVPALEREELAQKLKMLGIPTAIYYPIPLPVQSGYSHYPCAPFGTPVSQTLSTEVLSLPMHAYLSPSDQDSIIQALKIALFQ